MCRNILLRVAAFSLIACSPVLALSAPAINVGALHEYIQGNTFAKRINNTGDATAFVRVTVDEIVFNGSDYTEQPLDTNALIKGQGTGLLSSPARLIIPAKGMQTNRLLFIGDRDRERYYRVRYIPVIPDDVNEFSLTEKEIEDYQKQIDTSVTMLAGFGTIVTVMPEKPRFDTNIHEGAGRVQVVNKGNATVIIDALKECDSSGKNCNNPINHALRPGLRFEQNVKPGRVLFYNIIEGRNKKSYKSAHG